MLKQTGDVEQEEHPRRSLEPGSALGSAAATPAPLAL